MSISRGKQFETVVYQSFEAVRGVSVDRIHDQTTGFKGSTNICDFIVYRKPYEYYVECKSVHGNTLPFRNIADNQWNGLLEKSKIKGVRAGIICWYVDKDITLFFPIEILSNYKWLGYKSVRFNDINGYKIPGKKRRVYFDYNMEEFLNGLDKIRND